MTPLGQRIRFAIRVILTVALTALVAFLALVIAAAAYLGEWERVVVGSGALGLVASILSLIDALLSRLEGQES